MQEGNYLLRLTDGYITRPKAGRGGGSRAAIFEQAMADRIHRLANRPYAAAETEEMTCPNPLDVWVVGAPGWLSPGIPEPLLTICESETSDDYRIIVAGEGLEGIRQPHVPDWTGWQYSAGMKRKKRHTDMASFRHAAETLLGVMHDYFNDDGSSPTRIFHELGVPVFYAGAPGHNRDGAPSKRTQQ